jgi:hypothetical protein
MFLNTGTLSKKLISICASSNVSRQRIGCVLSHADVSSVASMIYCMPPYSLHTLQRGANPCQHSCQILLGVQRFADGAETVRSTCHLVQGGSPLRNADVGHADLPQHFQFVLLLIERFRNIQSSHTSHNTSESKENQKQKRFRIMSTGIS